MGLERRDGGVFYYTSHRYGRKVVKRYGGSGEIAVAFANLDAAMRGRRKLEALEQVEYEAGLRRKVANLKKWLARVGGVVAEAMRAAGWHQHKSEWRRKRGATVGAITKTETDRLSWLESDLLRSAGMPDAATADKAGKGDRSVAPAVAAYLTNPAAAALWGDMGRRVLKRWVMMYAGSCLTTETALLRFAADLRDRLTGPNPDALVQLVAERVVVGWVSLHYFESQYARNIDRLSIAQEKFHLSRIDLAHRHLMSAARTLAKVKRAKLPEVLALVSVAPPEAPEPGAAQPEVRVGAVSS